MKSFTDINEVYVVNLPERTDRKEMIDAELRHAGIIYTLFEAIRTESFHGLLETMKRLLDDAIKKNHENILVLEDDAMFVAPPVEFLNAVIPQLPGRFHLFYIGVNLTVQPIRISENILQIKKAYSSHAIIYSREGMQRVRSLLDDHITAYDIILMNQLQGERLCYASMPIIATQRAGYSDIERKNIDWGSLMTQTFAHHTRNLPMPEEKKTDVMPCFDAHRVGDIIPQERDLQLAGAICNCGRMKYIAEDCSCPYGSKKILKPYPNE